MNTKEMTKKQPSRLRHIGLIGMIVFGTLIVLGTILLVQNGKTYVEGDASYEDLRAQLQILELENSTGRSEEQGGEEQTSGETSADSVIIESLASLVDINPDFRAWIVQDETCIDYPVVIGGDNEYYINHLFNGEKNKLGCLFVDCINEGDFSDRNTVIYGHSMKNGSMFYSITEYKDPEVYETRPTMTIYTLDKVYTLELFAGIIVSGDYEFVEFEFESEDDFMEYVNNLKEESTFESDIEIQPGDKLVTLCTCSYEYNNARYALIGRLVEQN